MTEKQSLITFDDSPIRRLFGEGDGTWYFSGIDVIAALTGSLPPPTIGSR